MWAGLLLRVACIVILLLGSSARGYTGRKAPGHYSAERRRLGPHVCLSGFGSGCCPGWAPSMGGGHCTLPLCSFGCGSGICIAPNVCSCQDGEQGATCPEAHGSCGEYGCDLTCNHGGCQEVARVCPVGFLMTETAVGIRCADIDECLSSSCEGHCVNTEGGFVCECGPGMQLSADRHSCQDIDECLSSSCEGHCVNTEGGFVCECGPGMQLSADRHSCQDTDECLGTPCQQRCKNSIGSYKCSCRAGFHLHGNRHSCIDVNECRRPQERRVCHHSCHNTVGSFLCTCRPGFRLRADRVSCEGCFHSGAVREEGDVFSPPEENCTVCVCLAGNVSCISLECPPGPCKTPPQSDCCACAPGRCYFHGQWYTDGAVFSGGGDDCTTCVCQNGEVQCSFTPCPELECPREEWWLGPGQCCFTCREPTPTTGCSLDDNGVEFPIGQIWSPGDPCELCICQANGSVSCKRTDCVDSCPDPIRIPGQCCPDCSAGCTYTGRIFYNNETFPSVLDPCLSCICLLGSVACSPVDCPITCTYPFHPDGECCPVCHDCNFEGRKVVNGQVFTLDDTPCTRCICQLGEVSCEKVPCQPVCTDPSCPESLFPPKERQQPSPHGDLGKAAQSLHGDPEVPANCSSCPGPPSASPARPMLQLLQLFLRTNLSGAQSAFPGPPVAHTSSSPPLEPEGTFLGEPGASQPPEPSAGSSVSPGSSTLPPGFPGSPWSPATPESSSSTFGAAFQWPVSATHLTEAEASSTTGPDLSETLSTPLKPQRLSAALLDTPTPAPQQPTTDISKKEESTI
ncbi:von Willebrand factor C and EGF domain-containing protein [Microtus ochrogaster]|uniref:von Willebrand factor C and EGF domain-containing protein n=1 Tax=Microtus ochrogaster TaxID=79684 RepID=A0A8J6KXI4_MICOH|nr:von Willebrand factor C and EGF domain-containing protein [Microtus ochrogaster]